MKRTRNHHLPEDLLRDLYENQRMTIQEVADHLGYGKKVIQRNFREYGIQTRRTGPRNGSLHPGWKGGSFVSGRYRMVYAPDHPQAKTVHKSGGYIPEHRLVMEKMIGRYLEPGEVVHHKDDDPLNNAPDNLELYASNADHLRDTLTGKCPNWTEEGIEAMRESGKKGRKIEDDQLENVRRMYCDQQLSAEDIGERLNCAGTTVLMFLRRHGVPARKPWDHGRELPDREELLADYESLSLSQLRAKYGISVGLCYYWLQKHNIPLKRKRSL